MHQPPGFVSKEHPNHVCKLRKAIYGLKQAPRAWNARFAKFLMKLSFVISRADTSLFVFGKGAELAYILLYVDDIVLTTSSTTLLNKIIAVLKTEFPMTDLGRLQHFLGIKADFNKEGLFLSQSVYAQDIIDRANMGTSKPVTTPVDIKSKLSAEEGDKLENPTEYHSLAGALQYLTFTRPTSPTQSIKFVSICMTLAFHTFKH